MISHTSLILLLCLVISSWAQDTGKPADKLANMIEALRPCDFAEEKTNFPIENRDAKHYLVSMARGQAATVVADIAKGEEHSKGGIYEKRQVDAANYFLKELTAMQSLQGDALLAAPATTNSKGKCVGEWKKHALKIGHVGATESIVKMIRKKLHEHTTTAYKELDDKDIGDFEDWKNFDQTPNQKFRSLRAQSNQQTLQNH